MSFDPALWQWQSDICRRLLCPKLVKKKSLSPLGNVLTPFLSLSVCVCVRMLFQVLCNGPGTCVPLCAAGLLLGILGMKKVLIVYVESICRVQTLSLTGKILYPISDYFFVQWPSLRDKYPKSIFLGRIVWIFFNLVCYFHAQSYHNEDQRLRIRDLWFKINGSLWQM